jgi:hypothetical protein
MKAPHFVARMRARLRRHPIAVQAHFDSCLAITYALPAEVLRTLVPRGLELETVDGNGFLAVALVQTRRLRPVGAPEAIGQDFFLAGYRVFTRFQTREGRRLRGLRILRSDADRDVMVAAGNLLTHYNYHRCDATLDPSGRRFVATVRTDDGAGDLEVEANLDDARLPDGSPFASVREALRFAGPLPFTFDYERETDAIVAIEGRRANWRPQPVRVDVRRISFFDQPPFQRCVPRLAAAFHVSGIDYRWERGVRHAL